jgi:hypothetical protein
MSFIRFDASRLAGLCGKQTINALPRYHNVSDGSFAGTVWSNSATASMANLLAMADPGSWQTLGAAKLAASIGAAAAARSRF